MARWEVALERQTSLLRFWRTPAAQRYSRAFAESVAAMQQPSPMNYLAVPAIEGAKLERAEPVYVDANVLDVIDHARRSFRPEPILPEDLFCEEGFAMLERPVLLEDLAGKAAAFRAFSWGPVTAVESDTRRAVNVLHIVLYAHIDDDDDYSPELKAAYGTAGVLSLFGGPLSMFHAGSIPWGDVPAAVVDVGDDRSWTELWQFLQVFFRLAQQRVALRTREYGDRAARKRLRRLRPENDGVLVVALRRPKNPREGEPGAVDWQRQWVVSGHWRKQWYPSLGEHRQVWIAPYVKGPEDKPLVLHSGRVFEFTR